MTIDADTAAESLSALLRARTATDHRSAEGSGFTTALMRGTAPLEGYIDMLAQHWYAYEVLERVRDSHLADPEVGPFLDAALLRLSALEGDLVDLAGEGWRDAYPASPATLAYRERIEATAHSAAAHLAHHYTRYLGDLSGGQFMGKAAARAYDLHEGRGGRFAHFADIDDPAAYRDAYRARIDALEWDEPTQEVLLAAVHEAYACNEAVFDDLARHLS